MKPHRPTVVRSDELYAATCACGWRGTGAFPTPHGAHAELAEHVGHDGQLEPGGPPATP
ncbi:hypothetical protein [Nocardioides litoris]|uniref:hypothetical protein n=1 Tax=Nocardioides litoris TaxID=1926648 RepID=UPI001476ACFC|nr:hypothetical protein [Nocardioides litoris]